jgi:hypothetical protein
VYPHDPARLEGVTGDDLLWTTLPLSSSISQLLASNRPPLHPRLIQKRVPPDGTNKIYKTISLDKTCNIV